MPDPENTREWAPQVDVGGEDEIKRQEATILHQGATPTREFAPSVEGGPDELARGGEQFAASVAEMKAEKEVDEESVKEELLTNMPITPKTPPPVIKADVKEEAPAKTKE